MTIDYHDVDSSLRRVFLANRLDIQGIDEISARFAELACSEKRRVVVDLTAVTFLASMGIRELISNAKNLQRRGGRMVLFVGDNGLIARILETTNINQLLPMFKDLDDADKAALA
ncbi:STAS domain-containing protein [Pseudomonas sp. N040]|uniref:STAS domain-containing protein n=1 Tax=Pseudomonas sp. N040 TaxID=2785325 RepID=UPI0018A30F02|nr:STAS domain-containing protein [Pseudomonas sp. N040]MBF7728759.1 STAS domain-containing protein [Pseudomonas sp. N040]MBW7012399.1 STAS domain-containing protein [Pseudomonas sp. N040]